MNSDNSRVRIIIRRWPNPKTIIASRSNIWEAMNALDPFYAAAPSQLPESSCVRADTLHSEGDDSSGSTKAKWRGGGTMTKATSKRTRKQAKKLFKKLPHNTRPFSKADYDSLPSK